MIWSYPSNHDILSAKPKNEVIIDTYSIRDDPSGLERHEEIVGISKPDRASDFKD